MPEPQPDVIILGAGAAGLMCAIEAGRRGRRVLLLDRAERAGKKILISGGGRCNFTNIHCRPENFLSANPHFVRSALARYTPSDFLALVERHGIAWHEKTLGQLFCDGSAQQIVSMLLAECAMAQVELRLSVSVREVEAAGGGFALRLAGGDSLHAPALVVATGGLSIPKMGATGFGYDLAGQFGLTTQPPRPALVPFTLADDDRAGLCDLAGVSAEVIAFIGNRGFREKLLITHKGLSGPAILQISSYWDGAAPVTLDWVPEGQPFTPLYEPRARRNAAALRSALRETLAARLADRLIEIALAAESLPATQPLSNRALEALERRLHHWEFTPAGTEGFAKAEVTAGGVDTEELSAQTMECRRVPGLYFIGEVVDVTSHLGGFNFQWAWASGAAAGRAV